MAWVRISDDFPQHPKVVQVGPLGIAMQVAGLCYANHHLTDGFIPQAAVPTLMDFSELDAEAFNGRGGVCWIAVTKLLDAGVWVKTKGGFHIHEYLEYQPSKKQILFEREMARKRMQQVRRSPELRENFAGSSDAPTPTPTPTLKKELKKPSLRSEGKESTSPSAQPALIEGEETKPIKVKKDTIRITSGRSDEFVVEMHTKWNPTFGADVVSEMMREALGHVAASKRPDKDAYVNGWLRRESERLVKERGNGRTHAAGSVAAKAYDIRQFAANRPGAVAAGEGEGVLSHDG